MSFIMKNIVKNIVIFFALFSAVSLFAATTKIVQYTPNSVEALVTADTGQVGSFLVAVDDNSAIQLSIKSGDQLHVLHPSEYDVSQTMHIGPVPFKIVHPLKSANGTPLLHRGDKLSLEWNGTPHGNQPIPRALLPVIRSTIDNWNSVSDQFTVANYPGDFLIVTDDAYASNLGPYVDWKTQQGYHVSVKTLSEIGTTATEIRNYIRAQYAQSHGQLAYVLLVGDADTNHPDNVSYVPTFSITSADGSEQDPTDHPYSLMDDDYFSDLYVGRLTVDSVLEFVTVMNKLLNYEETPPQGNWLNKALLIAGNYSNTTNPITPVWTSRWLRGKLFDYGYSDVDTVFYPPTSYGNQTIANYINDGVGLVNYRGWANATGWVHPEFNLSDLNTKLNNAPYTPIVTSIVCNTGDFTNDYQDPAFGELFLRLGTPSNPKGAAGVFAPSDLHTSTKFNNSICAGFYEGLLEEGIYKFGAAAYRGKIQLYRSFPLDRSNGDWVDFYFHVYNILGDPSTEIRTRAVEEPNVDLPNELADGASTLHLQLNNSDIDDYTTVYATLISSEDTTGSYFDKSGSASLTFKPIHSDAQITITGRNIDPQIETIPVAQQNEFVSIANLQVSGNPQPGQSVILKPTMRNTGENSLSDITVALQPTAGITISGDNSFSVSSLAAGSEYTPQNGITIDIAPDYVNVNPQAFRWKVTSGSNTWYAGSNLVIRNTLFDVTALSNNSDQGFVTSGATTPLTFHLKNLSNYDSPGGSISVNALNSDLTVNGSNLTFAALSADSSSESITGLQVTVPGTIPNGSTLTLVFSIEENDGRQFEVRKTTTVGPVQSTDPVGPDAYGYFAYDNTDTQYDAAPTDEAYRSIGNNAVLHSLEDDQNVEVSLPWDFQYYGQSFNAITISSNGWISFLPEDIAYFRNWPIPSPIGPKGLVAGYWDDLNAPDGQLMQIYTEDTGDEFVITWDRSYANYDGTTPEKFQIILKNTASDFTPTGDDEILLLYNQVQDVDQINNYSTVGIEAPNKREGVQYVYAGQYTPGAATLEAGRAILFTTRQPDGFIVNNAPETNVPQRFNVSQNYPNPFNPSTQFTVDVPQRGNLQITLYNIRGERVWEQTIHKVTPGQFPVQWNGKTFSGNAPSGIYLARVRYITGNNVSYQTIKMTLLR